MIRPGTADDAEGVARVQVETWQSAYAHALPSEQLEALSLEEAFERHRRWPPTFVADDGGQIVGFVSVGSSRDPGTYGELFAIYVHPEQWGTGVGRELIEAGEEELRRLGHREALLAPGRQPEGAAFLRDRRLVSGRHRPRDPPLRLRHRRSPLREAALGRVESTQQVVGRHHGKEQGIDPVEHATVCRQ